MTVETFDTAGVRTGGPGGSGWPCPSGVTSVTVRCWGSGAGGGTGVFLGLGGGGGGGGGYSEGTVAVTPGTIYAFTIGAAGVGATTQNAAGTAGGDTFFHTAGTVMAKGGGLGQSATGSGTGGAGGASGSGVGTTKTSGGAGRAQAAGGGGGGGGSGGSSTGGSGGGTGGTAGAAGTGTYPGATGGTGGTGGVAGTAGAAPGAGGAGASNQTPYTGGNGAVGRLEIEYTAVTATPTNASTNAGLSRATGSGNRSVASVY